MAVGAGSAVDAAVWNFDLGRAAAEGVAETVDMTPDWVPDGEKCKAYCILTAVAGTKILMFPPW